MKVKQLLKAVPLLSAVLMFSCNRENVVKNDSGNSRISFKISIPQGDPVTYTLHDADEWGIESLWMCEYKEEGGSWKLVKSPVDIKSQLQNTGPEYTYTKELTDADKGVRKFVFVANENIGDLRADSPFSELESKVASKTLNERSGDLLNDFQITPTSVVKRIPMTGKALQNGNDQIRISGATQPVEVEMVRIVARIDIENKVQNLTITDVKLSNTNSQSYLFEKRESGTIQNPQGSQKKNGVVPFATKPSSFVNGQIMNKAFYLYEGNQENAGSAASIEVRGQLNGVDIFYRIPLWKDGSSNFAVVRNHLYKIILGSATTPGTSGTGLTVTIEVNDWNNIGMSETFAIISAVKNDATGTFDASTKTLTVDKTAHDNMTFTFKTLFQGHTTFTANASTTLDGTSAAAWLTANFSSEVLSVTTQANDSGSERTAYIIVTSNADAATKYVLKVIQKGNQQ